MQAQRKSNETTRQPIEIAVKIFFLLNLMYECTLVSDMVTYYTVFIYEFL